MSKTSDDVWAWVIGIVFYGGIFLVAFGAPIYDALRPANYSCDTKSIAFKYSEPPDSYNDYDKTVVSTGSTGLKQICTPDKDDAEITEKVLTWPTDEVATYSKIEPEPVYTPVAPTYEYGGGAICGDGTRSYSTGRGTCSWHGGVDYWL